MSKNYIPPLIVITLILAMSVIIFGKWYKNTMPVRTTTVSNGVNGDVIKAQKESAFDCNTFSGALDQKYCKEDTRIADSAILSGDIGTCEKLSNTFRKESCREQIVTRKAAKSGKSADCDILLSTGAKESCRANMSYWKAVEDSILTQ